ncbi:MAG: aminoacyl-histidine dipeptidase [Clostridia bacterium]|nr:aminoacyl-histidine dipeptidase [Clostridia bacterium]
MKRVLELFEALCAIPHGSGNMEGISAWCVDFAQKRGLEAARDEARNVIIKKKATPGYENAPTVMLQGHLDMVCQKVEESPVDFEKDGIKTFVKGDYLKAEGTTLGADNGIAVAMVLAILEREDLSHPALEAVFTTDEEIGMLGALELDMSLLKAEKMINLDSEEDDVVTVSCAGGSDFVMSVPFERKEEKGTHLFVTFKGLQGGHSGVEIHKGRVNADLLAGRFLQHMKASVPFSLLSVNGGDKSNAIPRYAKMEIVTSDPVAFLKEAASYLETVKHELAAREPGFVSVLETEGEGSFAVMEKSAADRVIAALCTAPNGVVNMSADIPGLVETSLNLGILETKEDAVSLHFALRSNFTSGLVALEEKLFAFASLLSCKASTGGHYPPWEYRADSRLRDLYTRLYEEKTGKKAKVEAIHAGLECGVFAAGIPNLDCIAIGPTLFDVHTTEEKMSISSAEKIYGLLTALLKECR